MALLLAVIGYQNLVTYPRLMRTMNSPKVYPIAAVNVGTWGSSERVIPIRAGEGVALLVRIPPEGGYSYYKADLNNPEGKVEWTVTIPATSAQDQWSVQVPGTDRAAGRYTLVVHGVTAGGESKDVGRASFELQIQK